MGLALLCAPPVGAVPSPPLRLERITYRGWKDSYRLSAGPYSLVVVPAIGGRIMAFSLGGRNSLWENPAEFGKLYGPNPDPWRNYGGYKTWNAPQSRWGFPPDTALDRGPAHVRVLKTPTGAPRGLEILGQSSDRFHLRFRKRVFLDPKTGAARLEQFMTNTGGKPQTWALWDVTQVPAPCTVAFQANPKSRFPKGIYTYGQTKDTGQVSRDGDLVVVTWKGESAKFGGDCAAGWMVGLRGDLAYVKRFPPMSARHTYADEGAYAQVYTNGRELPYVEMEVSGPLVTLAPGGETGFVEEWQVVRLGSPKLSVQEAVSELRTKGVLHPAGR
jgi:hypothetical protein